jgi:hypothetical protein
MSDTIKGKLNEGYASEIRKGFEYRCIFTLIDGYRLMKKAGEYNPAWEEESLTANLIKHMKRSPCSSDWRLDIIPEFPVYSKEIYDGSIKPREAPVIDVRIMNWNSAEILEYFIEAKNLVENDWIKPDGSKMKASKLRARYIDTGIDNFTKKRYPPGCLVGYVLAGHIDNIIKGINKLLKSTRRNRPQEIITKKEPVNGHPYCYISKHPGDNGTFLSLNHIFLKF